VPSYLPESLVSARKYHPEVERRRAEFFAVVNEEIDRVRAIYSSNYLSHHVHVTLADTVTCVPTLLRLCCTAPGSHRAVLSGCVS